MKRLFAFLYLALPILACDPANQTPADFIVRDSSGVRIVDYPEAPTATSSITFSADPLFRHGDRAGDYLFQTVWIGALQPDGGAVVGDLGSQEVVVLGPDGALRSVLSRLGEGPTEVRSVRSVHVIGQDTILIEDDGNAKFMVFENGALARTVSTMGDRAVTTGFMAQGIDSTGQLLMVPSAFRSRFDQPWLQGHMVRFDLDEGVADTAAAYDMASHTPEEGPRNPFPPFGVATATGSLFVHARSDIPELIWRNPDGAVWQIVRWKPERGFPSDQHWQALEARLRTDLTRVNPQLSGSELEAFIQRQLAGYEIIPDEPFPLFLTLEGDDTGGVWMGDFAIIESLEGLPQYTVVGPNGEWIGTVECPPRFRLLDVGYGKALGVLRDELDVQSVAVYQVSVARLEGG